MSHLDRWLADLREWEWVGILLARLAVGVLFFLTGEMKLFRRERQEQMRQTIREAGIPFPDANALFVSLVEFVFGFLLIIGLVTQVCCVMLGGVMIVAIATTSIKKVKAKSPIDWLSEFLFIPDVLYLVMLIWLFFAGPGWLSVDHWLRS